jgi:hypothetical protein
MTPGDIPDRYQNIIDHNDYLITKISRLQGENITLRQQLQEAYSLLHRARDTAALLEVVADAGLGLAYSGYCEFCDSRGSTDLSNCPDKHGWHKFYNRMADVIEDLL